MSLELHNDLRNDDKDLDYHATVLDILETGKDSVMVIHGGGVYGIKRQLIDGAKHGIYPIK